MEYFIYPIAIFFLLIIGSSFGEALGIKNGYLAFLVGAIIFIILIYLFEIVIFPNSEFIY